MANVNILIKPASGMCNLRCKYCFYYSIAGNREVESYGIMTKETLETIVKKGIEYSDTICGFTFQGGEPTLTGIKFYEELIELQNKYNKKNIKIHNAIQTNGTLIDEEWAKFFKKNNFLVGLSLDGYNDVHNLNRIGLNGKDTFNDVMKTVRLFNKYKVEYNILYVVTSNTARHAHKIYDFFRANRFKYIQFIPCLDPIGEEQGNQNYSLKSKDMENFLKITFDRWYEDFINDEYISIRYFDNLVSMIMGERPESCSMVGQCSCNLVIEADGGVYPCDFYVLDKWRLGNINDKEIEEIRNSQKASEFVKNSIQIPMECTLCKWQYLCRGGRRREREDYKNNKLGVNYYCLAYRNFFEYSYDRLVKVARSIMVNSK